MKIISLNLAGRKNFGEKIEERLERIVAFLDSEKADVVCFQEVTFSNTSNLAYEINQKMQNPYKFVQADLADRCVLNNSSLEINDKKLHSDIKNKEMTDGSAILSNFEIESSKKLILSPVPPDERGRPDFHVRIAQIIKFKNGLKLANVHFASNNNSYLQLQELLSQIDKEWFVVGDFNMKKFRILEKKSLWQENYFCSIEFKDYISCPDVPLEYATIDYLLLPKEYHFVDIETTENLSDHFAMSYEIEF